MVDTPVKQGNRSLCCPQCDQNWNRCQCSTRQVFASESLVGAIRSAAGTEGDAPSDAEIGTLVANKYEIIKKLGEGGIGSVFLAEHVTLKSRLALKILRKDLIEDPEIVERLKREAQACAILNHPNLVSVSDFGMTDNGFPYIVMEYLEGLDLDRIISKSGALEKERLIRMVMQLCDGLEEAHKHGVVHRDLKPTNILITNPETDREAVKIVDFGIAKAELPGGEMQHLTQTGEVLGSPAYMSPEQIQGLKIDGRSDIYSFGCVLHEMLTGKQLFRGPTLMSTLQANLEDEPPPFVSKDKQTKELRLLFDIAFKCLEKERDDRFQDIAEVRAALEAASAPEGIPGWIRTAALSSALFITGIVIGILFPGSPIDRAPVVVKETAAQSPQAKPSGRLLNLSGEIAMGRILDNSSGLDPEAQKAFRQALMHGPTLNEKLLAAGELLDELRDDANRLFDNKSKFKKKKDEMDSVMTVVGKLSKQAMKRKDVNLMYAAHCYFVYGRFCQGVAGHFEKKRVEKLEGVEKENRLAYVRTRDPVVRPNYAQAIDALKKAINLAEAWGSREKLNEREKRYLEKVYGRISDCLEYISESGDALQYRQKRLDLQLDLNGGDENDHTIDRRVDLGKTYIHTGKLRKARSQLEIASRYYSKKPGKDKQYNELKKLIRKVDAIEDLSKHEARMD